MTDESRSQPPDRRPVPSIKIPDSTLAKIARIDFGGSAAAARASRTLKAFEEQMSTVRGGDRFKELARANSAAIEQATRGLGDLSKASKRFADASVRFNALGVDSAAIKASRAVSKAMLEQALTPMPPPVLRAPIMPRAASSDDIADLTGEVTSGLVPVAQGMTALLAAFETQAAWQVEQSTRQAEEDAERGKAAARQFWLGFGVASALAIAAIVVSIIIAWAG